MLKDKIFLIDDNDDLLFNLKILFEVNNFDTVTATNGKLRTHIIEKIMC